MDRVDRGFSGRIEKGAERRWEWRESMRVEQPGWRQSDEDVIREMENRSGERWAWKKWDRGFSGWTEKGVEKC